LLFVVFFYNIAMRFDHTRSSPQISLYLKRMSSEIDLAEGVTNR
jgi:hypothetical protein